MSTGPVSQEDGRGGLPEPGSLIQDEESSVTLCQSVLTTEEKIGNKPDRNRYCVVQRSTALG